MTEYKKIRVMISSTVSDLVAEREAIAEVFKDIPFVELLGAHPYNNSAVAGSSFRNTISYARKCDLYILILGTRFGFDSNGKSATEREFDAAYKSDPTKILVFLKEDEQAVEERQQKFVNRVCNYYSGYWRTSFKFSHELQQKILASFFNWIQERVSFNNSYTYCDHFIRLAIQKKPNPDISIFYSVKSDHVEIEYRGLGDIISIHFGKKELYRDFWGCLYKLEEMIDNAIDE